MCLQQSGWRDETRGRERHTKGNPSSQAATTGTYGRSRAKNHRQRQKRNTVGDKQKEWRKSKGWSDQKKSEKKPQKIEKGREKRTEGHQQGQERGQVGERQREEVREQYSPKRQEEVP